MSTVVTSLQASSLVQRTPTGSAKAKPQKQSSFFHGGLRVEPDRDEISKFRTDLLVRLAGGSCNRHVLFLANGYGSPDIRGRSKQQPRTYS